MKINKPQKNTLSTYLHSFYEENEDNEDKTAPLLVSITFIKDTEPFCDLTGNEIGGFTSGTSAVVNKNIAKILIEDGRAINNLYMVDGELTK